MTVTGETLGGHESASHHGWLGRRLFEEAQVKLDSERPLDLSAGTRMAEFPLSKDLYPVFEQLFGSPGEGVRLVVRDDSLGVNFELVDKGLDFHQDHPFFYATKLDYTGPVETDTGLIARVYEGTGFGPKPVEFLDAEYQKIQLIAELFIPVLGGEFGL
jgi:hypothetical protein